MRSHLRVASVVGAATLSLVAAAPALAAAPVSQAGANAVYLALAGNGNGTGDVTATNDGSRETTSGDATPPISVLKHQALLNGGVLAQEATARADGTSAACAGLAGNGGSVAQVGDSSCLNPGTPLNATLGSLNFKDLIVADPDSALAGINGPSGQVLDQVKPLITQAVGQAQDQFGNPGLVAGFGVLEGRCTARPGSATGDATLADANARLEFPKGSPQESVTLLDLPLHPKPNTHLTTDLSDVADMILDAIDQDLTTSLNGQAAPLKTLTEAVKKNIVTAVRDNVEKNLAPLEQNLLDVTLNRQIRSGRDSIKVRALDLQVVPAAKGQVGAPLANLQVGNAACGPNNRVAAAAPAPKAPKAPAAMPTAVSAGYATAPGGHHQGESPNAIVLGAFAALLATAAGFVTVRRLRA